VFSLNFIFVGWFGIYALIMAYAWLFGIFNALFVIAKHSQRMKPFNKLPRVTMPLLYTSEGFAALLSIGFIILASVRLQYYGQDENRRTDNE
jgi:hypothetical protein